MLTGKALGAAIEDARLKKRVTKRTLAMALGVKPPSVQDWVKRGTIDKAKLPALWAYFADVVGPTHWGLPAPSSLPPAGTALTTTTVKGSLTAQPDLAELVVDAVASMTPTRWTSVRAQLEDLAAHPEKRDDILPELRALLALPVSGEKNAA